MPVLPIVAVEVPLDLPATLATATVRACESALGLGRCTLQVRPSDDAPCAWIATVLPDPAQSGQVRVDLRRSVRAPAQIRLTRTLNFEANEEELHRWSTVGVVVAALVVSGSQSTNSPLPSEAQPQESNPAQPTSLAESKRVPAQRIVAATDQPKTNLRESRNAALARLTLAGTWGGSLEQGSQMRLGGVLRPSLLVSDWVSLWLGIAGSRSSEEVVSYVWSGAVGVGFAAVAPGRQIGIEGRLGIRGDQVTFRAAEGTRTDGDSRLRWGPTAGLDVSIGLFSAIDLVLICEGAFISPRVLVNLHDDRVGQLGYLDGAVGLGLRAWFGHYPK